MTNLRILFLSIVTAGVLVSACAGVTAQPTPSPVPTSGTVDTPEKAVAAVIAREPRFRGITPILPDVIGQSSWYTVTQASGVGAYIVEIRVGWGDCQAGCIDEHVWTFAVQPDGTVNLQSETGGAVPPDAWPQPAGSGQTGIVGVAVAGPICPVETLGDPTCAPRPVAGATIVVMDGSGTEVARAITGVDGAFTIPVPAGQYSVGGEAVEGLMGTPEVTPVSVVDGSASPVQLSYDTGIR